MKIVVCIRQGLDGEISPFDACAYEAALSVSGAEVTRLAMAKKSNLCFAVSNAIFRLMCYSVVVKAETKIFKSLWLIHFALGYIYLKPQFLFDKPREISHHSISRHFTSDHNNTVIRISHKV